MKLNPRIFLNAYMLVAIVHIFSLTGEKSILQSASKIALMPCLILYVLFEQKWRVATIIFLLTALFFSWAGDIVLLFTLRNELYFMAGLAAFLLAHCAYIVTFRNYMDKPNPGRLKIYYYLPVITYSILLFSLIYKGLNDMKVPVIVYTIVISAMAIAALSRYKKTDMYSFIFVSIGAIFFIASDSLIALNKFHSTVPNASIYIMLTYIIAQYLIVTGCMLHIKQKTS